MTADQASRRHSTSRLAMTVLVAFVVSVASSSTATAQVSGGKPVGATPRSVEAAGTMATGETVTLSAGSAGVTPGTPNNGRGCVSIEGLVNGEPTSQSACGWPTVEIDDLLSSARVSGTFRTAEYGADGSYTEGEIKLNATVIGTGQLTPETTSGYLGSWPQCNGFFYIGWGCYLATAWNALPNALVKRSGSATGQLTSSIFGTSGFSGNGTLYLYIKQQPSCCP